MDKWNKLYIKEFYQRNGDKEKGERIPEDLRTSSPCIFQHSPSRCGKSKLGCEMLDFCRW